jgi:hypothetical protein
MRATFAPSACRIYADTLRMTSGFRFSRPLARVPSPLCASCSSGQSFAYSFLRTPPRDDALAVRLAVPVIKARRGLSPPSRPAHHHSGPDQRQSRRYAPCLAHAENAPGDRGRCFALRLRAAEARPLLARLPAHSPAPSARLLAAGSARRQSRSDAASSPRGSRARDRHAAGRYRGWRRSP